MVHCSATPAAQDIGRTEIDRMHRQRGFAMIGYHFVIRRSGEVEAGRPIETIGAHVEGFNSHSIGVCLVGGLKADGKTPEANFTPAQFDALQGVLASALQHYPRSRICGHRDLSPDLNHDGRITSNEWMKACPTFDVADFVKARHIA